MTTWISTFLVKQHGLDLKTMGFFASLPYIVAFFSIYFGGWMADNWFGGKPKVVTVISFLGCIRRSTSSGPWAGATPPC